MCVLLVGVVCPIVTVGRTCCTRIGCWWNVPGIPWLQSLQYSACGCVEEPTGTSCHLTWFFPWTWLSTCCLVGVDWVESHNSEGGQQVRGKRKSSRPPTCFPWLQPKQHRYPFQLVPWWTNGHNLISWETSLSSLCTSWAGPCLLGQKLWRLFSVLSLGKESE